MEPRRGGAGDRVRRGGAVTAPRSVATETSDTEEGGAGEPRGLAGEAITPLTHPAQLAGDLLVGVVAREPMRSRVEKTLTQYGISVAAEAETPRALAQATAHRPPHVAVVAWSHGDGTTEVRALATALRRTRIVAVIPTNRRSAIRAALAAGADGVVLAGTVILTLPVAVLSVWHGQASVPIEARSQLGAAPLSHREHEVVALAAEGMSNSEIAATLTVAESTVKSHLASVFTKLGVHTRTEALMALGEPPAFGPTPPRQAGGNQRVNGGTDETSVHRRR
jgi:DNA-binding NarL/FixJ family response regulator